MKIDRILEAGVVAMLCVFVGVLYMSLHDNVVSVGDRAPDFSITAESGQTITAHDFGGKLLIVNFWASWCPPCVEEAPSLRKLAKTLGPKGLVVLGISQDTDQQAYQDFINRFGISFLTARDPSQEIKHKYGTVEIPESYFIDRNGKVVEKIVSAVDWSSEQMVQHVQSLL